MGKGAVGFRDSLANFTKITNDITSQRFAPIYLLMGEEGYFIDALSDRLAITILDEGQRAFSQIVVYGRDSNCGDVINLCRQMPMMGNYQVVIVKEAQQMRDLDQMSLYTQAPSSSTILILCHKEKGLDKRGALYRHIAKQGIVFESVRPRDYEIGGWLSDFIRSKGCEIEPKALTMLTDHLGVDIAKISNELDKLIISLPEGTKMVTEDHIEQNIGISKEFNNFELTRAISERDMVRALLIADHFSKNQRDNPLVVTLSTLFSHFQRIFILNYQNWLVSRGRSRPLSDMELCGAMKLHSSFFLKEYRQAAQHYPNSRVFLILGLLREYDMKSKGVNDGGADDGELLRELLLKIFMVEPNNRA